MDAPVATDFDCLFFLGIGGIGMSALAHYFHEQGMELGGYDRDQNPQTERLKNLGISISHEDDPQSLDASYRDSQRCMIVYTPAISSQSLLRQYFEKRGFVMRKRAVVLASLANQHFLIAVAGAHGKTTTSVCLAHLLVAGGKAVRAFLGGVSVNYQRNYISQGDAEDATWIVEADEYDRSFHHLRPQVAILTSTDADHLDVYGSQASVQKAYETFVQGIQSGGCLIRHESTQLKPDTLRSVEVEVYGQKQGSWTVEPGPAGVSGARFSLHNAAQSWEAWMPVPGMHNLLNATAALMAARHAGQSTEQSVMALAHFRGIRRRFELRFRDADWVYIDDYAHHPRELHATIGAVRELLPGWTITGVFQPHLFSRTRDFAADFGQALSALDHLVLLPIYPAREAPIPGVHSSLIVEHITRSIPVYNLAMEEVLPWLKTRAKKGALLTLGAGSIDQLADPIHQYLLSAS